MFSKISYGPAEPDEAYRDYPWFKTDHRGNPVGWFEWNGWTWATLSL